jgi:osmotically-inducible protein OsmY
MNASRPSLVERICVEAHRRLGADGRIDTSDLDVKLEADGIVIEGSVDDAFSKSLVESVARELAGSGNVTNRLSVRSDLAAEAGPKETEFGTAEAVHEVMTSIPRP